jgi:hypothetical protein
MEQRSGPQGTSTARLVIREGPLPGQAFPVAGGRAYIGRDVANDIVIDNPEVSRRHASIYQEAGRYVIEDLGSTNGTFVNGVRVTGPQPLHDGDIVGLGQVVLAFEEAFEAGEKTVISAQPTAPSLPAQPVYAPPPPPQPAYVPPPPPPQPAYVPPPPPPQPAYVPPPPPPQPAYVPPPYQPMEAEQGGGGGRWLLIGCGCLAILVLLVVIAVVAILVFSPGLMGNMSISF